MTRPLCWLYMLGGSWYEPKNFPERYRRVHSLCKNTDNILFNYGWLMIRSQQPQALSVLSMGRPKHTVTFKQPYHARTHVCLWAVNACKDSRPIPTQCQCPWYSHPYSTHVTSATLWGFVLQLQLMCVPRRDSESQCWCVPVLLSVWTDICTSEKE